MPADDLFDEFDRVHREPADTDWSLDLLSAGDELEQPELVLGVDDPMGAIPARGLTCLFGPAGTGKTWTAVDMAMCAATGSSWGGLDSTLRTRTLYLSTEAPAVTARRLRDWAAFRSFDLADLDEWVFFSAGQLSRRRASRVEHAQVDLDSEESAGVVIDFCRASDVGLVVVDTLSTARTGEEDDNTETNRMLRTIKPLWQERALLLVHHPTKGDPRNMRGAGAVYNAADQVLVVKPRRPLDPITMEEDKPKRGGVPWGHAHEWRIVRHSSGVVTTLHESEGGPQWP